MWQAGNLKLGRYLRDIVKVKVTQSLYKFGQALGVTEIWGSQICRQSTQKGSKVVTALCTGRLNPHSHGLFMTLISVRSLCGRKDYVQFQWHNREQYPRLPGLKCSASTNCATACLDCAGFLAPSPSAPDACLKRSNLSLPLMHAAQTVLLAGLWSRRLNFSTTALTFVSQSPKTKRKFQMWNLK